MPPVNVPKESDYFSRYLKEGSNAPEDAEFDPELQRTLAALYQRQRDEAYDLICEQDGDIIYNYGTPDHPYMNKEHRADTAAQNERFAAERQRYIREYHDAKVLREELKQREQERSLNPEQERGRSP